MRLGLLALLTTFGIASWASAQQVELHLFGKPYFAGGMNVSVTAPALPGANVLLAFGLNPLPLASPIGTSKGPWYIGALTNVIALGATDKNGRLILPFGMPPFQPSFLGLSVVLQGYVPNAGLSNPALLPFDLPAYMATNAVAIDNPMPTTQALFGDRVAVGDLNGDGVTDLAMGAWFEDYQGIDKAGRVYVMWGPDYAQFTALQPVAPTEFGCFGANVVIAELNGDDTDDLVVGETTGTPPVPGRPGFLHVYPGGPSFAASPALSVPSLGTGTDYVIFGKLIAAGDFNGDSNLDLAAGVLNATVAGMLQVGRIDVYWGPDFSVVASIDNPLTQAASAFGDRLVVADVTGDGRDDLVVSSGKLDVGEFTNSGVVRAFSCMANTFELVVTIDNPHPGSNVRFGEGSCAADLNGDGIAEIVVSDVKNRFYIFWSPDFNSFSERSKPYSGAEGLSGASSFGYFFDTGDVNGDGRVDILIADSFAGALTSCGSAKEGTCLISLAPYFSTFHIVRNPDPHCGDDFSWDGELYDIDKNGTLDLVMPADTSEIGLFQNAGRVFVMNH